MMCIRKMGRKASKNSNKDTTTITISIVILISFNGLSKTEGEAQLHRAAIALRVIIASGERQEICAPKQWIVAIERVPHCVAPAVIRIYRVKNVGGNRVIKK